MMMMVVVVVVVALEVILLKTALNVHFYNVLARTHNFLPGANHASHEKVRVSVNGFSFLLDCAASQHLSYAPFISWQLHAR